MVLEPCVNRACTTNGSFDCLPQRICYHLERLEAQYEPRTASTNAIANS